jgi:T5SS/PEP-CTERM-associated repeat protein
MAFSRARRLGDFSAMYRLLGLIIQLCAAMRLEAAEKIWQAPFGGSFNSAANWEGGVVPGASDVARFERTLDPTIIQLNYTVTFSASVINQALEVEDDFVTFDLNGHLYDTTQSTIGVEVGTLANRTGKLTINDGSIEVFNNGEIVIATVANSIGFLTLNNGGRIINSSGAALVVGESGSGTLTVDNGSVTNVLFAFIGHLTGSTGTVNVSGAGTSFRPFSMNVGMDGTGTVNITTGGTIQTGSNTSIAFSDTTGTVNVDGEGSQLINPSSLSIGSGDGTLNITAGGRVQNSAGMIGTSTNGNGVVTVAGITSEWINSADLTIGEEGDGTLHLISGGQVENVNGFIGRDAGSTGTVTLNGIGSTWFNNGDLFVGHNGDGTLLIEARANVFNDNAVVGLEADSSGMVTVSGPSSDWINSGNLTVGNLGEGTLIITGGGSVSSAEAFIGDGGIGTAAVSGTDSLWSNSSLIVGSTGTLTVTDGGVVTVDNNLTVEAGGELGGNGQIVGNVNNLGAVAPGTSPGALSVMGNYAQPATGSLEIELAGTLASSQYDQLLVSDSATLGGTLEVALTGSFTPAAGEVFTILDADSLSGTFSNVTNGQRLDTIGGEGSFVVNYIEDTGSVVLSSFLLLGDFNGNGSVDAADYVVWRKTDGAQASYDTWRENFGATIGSGAGARTNTTVPEPTTIFIALVGTLAVSVGSGRQCHKLNSH